MSTSSVPELRARPATRPPKTIEELRVRFRLKNDAEVEAMLGTFTVKETLRRYLNRCLSTKRLQLIELPGWKAVDEYLEMKRESLPRAKSAASAAAALEHVEDACVKMPFGLMPHVALFVLRIEAFLVSEEGKAFDVASRKFTMEHQREREFERRWSATDLLYFLVNRRNPN